MVQPTIEKYMAGVTKRRTGEVKSRAPGKKRHHVETPIYDEIVVEMTPMAELSDERSGRKCEVVKEHENVVFDRFSLANECIMGEGDGATAGESVVMSISKEVDEEEEEEEEEVEEVVLASGKCGVLVAVPVPVVVPAPAEDTETVKNLSVSDDHEGTGRFLRSMMPRKAYKVGAVM